MTTRRPPTATAQSRPRPAPAGPPPARVQSVDRVIALLDVLGQAARPLSVRELSAAVGLPRPTTYRLIHSLSAGGVVVATDGGYAIGPRILSLAAHRLEQIELRAVGRPFLLTLRDDSGETAHLAVLEQGQVVYIDKAESPGPLRMASAIGKIMSAHCTSLGKAMLAHLREAEARRIIEVRGLPRRTPNTITDPGRLREELAAVRARGYAIDNVENEDGIRCVGAPIMDHRGLVVGAISLSGSTAAITLERARRELGPRVRATAQRISRALGWEGALPVREGGES